MTHIPGKLLPISATPNSRATNRLRRLLSPLLRRLIRRLGFDDRPHDRYLLEEVIFPSLGARTDVRCVLFAGCEIYTAHYADLFADRTFVTIDPDPAKARYGAPGHIIDTLANVREYFHPTSLDVVICNGVIGWGLDDAEEIDRAASQCFECLRPGGIFIVGWNDIPPWKPVAFQELDGFRRFAGLTFPPFPGPVYPTLGKLRHVYSFYVRPQP